MTTDYFSPFSEHQTPFGKNILTITQRFPSATQPWFVNHLDQIIKHGGDTRILSRPPTAQTLPRYILESELLNKSYNIAESQVGLLSEFVKALPRSSIAPILRNIEWSDLSLKQSLHAVFLSPFFSINCDVIHSHSEIMGNRLRSLIKASGKPFVHTFHGLTPHGVPDISESDRREYTRLASAVLVNTKFAQRQYEMIGAECDNFVIIPQGTDLSLWDFNPSTISEDKPLRCLTVARLDEDKGHKYVLEAIAKLLADGIDIHYEVVGSGSYAEKLKEQVKALGITENVTFHGVLFDSAIFEIYKQSDVFVLPSLSSHNNGVEETQGVVVQEAQAAGLIVIATQTGGLPECIREGETGYLVKDRCSDSICSAILDAIKNPDKTTAMQLAARQQVRDEFCIEKIGVRVRDFYCDVASRKRP